MEDKQKKAISDLARLRRSLSAVPNLNVDLAFLPAARTKLFDQKSIREEALRVLADSPDAPEVCEAREALQKVEESKRAAETRIATLDAEVPVEEKSISQDLLQIEQIKTKGIPDPQRAAENYCPNSLLKARERKCVPGGPIDPATMQEIAELEASANRRRQQLQAKIDEKARLESDTERLELAQQQAKAELADARKKHPSPLLQVQSEITLIASAIQNADEAITSDEETRTLSSEIEQATKNLDSLRKDLSRHKIEAEFRLREFSDIFSDIVRAVLGANVTATAELQERGIVLKVLRQKELGGAALETIKTLSFDLAAVVQSMEGKCDHPRFLIHDGPREADMARVVYERFFYFARRMEEASGESSPTFQYILTTTTHPPPDMQEGSYWLLGDKLSAKTKSGRLLQEDF